MKNKLAVLLFFALITIGGFAQQTTTKIFDEVLFYDGYAARVDLPVPADVIRHRNDLYAKKITDQQLASFGNEITMNVVIKAACDNYDRIGNVNLALVPKGQTTYELSDVLVQRLELGRYITPFMSKNRSPKEVPFSFELNNISRVFRDRSVLERYDIWLELELFGVPYSAQNEVSGCAGRTDVFYGSVDIVSNAPNPTEVVDDLVLLPLLFKHELNNYQAGASDVLGQTKKTVTFELDQKVYNAKLYLITSNHGADTRGEEYVRRKHFAYFDNSLVLEYKPGGKSCEPYRKYNTQGNGIYSPVVRTEADWTSWNNWCPGDVIPIRIIDLGTLEAGTHHFALDVPDAEFFGGKGMFPLSLYLQAHDKPYNASVREIAESSLVLYPNPTSAVLTISAQEPVSHLEVFDLTGKKIGVSQTQNFDFSRCAAGTYVVKITWENGAVSHRKIIKN
ncbi:peptide-N-glycosidase F-related protein [Flavobacterium sp. JP2137]|uniref:peptide-N-glycosidase F-related protein n=1 Tax=Flavobacterium sp. JP2137 TaxID=3414510 RepID=UPI003D2FE935